MNYNMYNSFEMDEIDVVVVYVCRVVWSLSMIRADGWTCWTRNPTYKNSRETKAREGQKIEIIVKFFIIHSC